MKWILTARPEEDQDRELAAILVESKNGDEIVVETWSLRWRAAISLGIGDCSGITLTVDAQAVENERARIRGVNAVKVTGKLVGAERHSPRMDIDLFSRHFGIPGPTPGTRTFEVRHPPQPEHVHHPVPGDEANLPSQEE